MLHLPQEGQKNFVVSMYNKVVRELVKENRSHDFYDDFWADCQRRDVAARDEDDARSKMAERFPPEQGFVIESMQPHAV